MTNNQARKENTVREPSLVDALIPLLFMIVLLATSIGLFGIDAATGPLQVALFMSAVVAAIVAHKNGHTWERLGEEIVKGISLAMSAIMILLMVGALIGVWNMSGTIATMVYYGVKYIDPAWFYFAAALLTGNRGDRHGQLLVHRGNARGGVYRYGGCDRCRHRHHGRSCDLRCLLWGLDDPIV